ncbi:MAG: efflux RND transporter periplasmic adaptor subunit [Ginsengibacter sp.]
MHSRRFLFLLVGFAASLLFFQSCHTSEEKKEVKKEVTESSATPVVLVSKGGLTSSIQIPGELFAWQQVDLYAKVNSFINKIYVDVGSEVKQGQLLATMEAPEINSQLAASNSKLKSFEAIYIASKANYDRLIETSKTPGTVSPNDLDMASARQKSDYAQYQAAKSAYDESVNNRNYLQIRAPFSGVISARNVSQGAYVGPSGKGSEMPLFTLQTQQKLRLVVSVPQAYSAYVTNKSEVSFTVVSLPNQTFKARVKRLAGTLDPRFRSERIEMDVNNTDKQLMPGMVAEIQISLPAQENAFIVPATALVNSLTGVAVIKVGGTKALWTDVKKGRTVDDKAEVYGNLNEGDTIVAKGNEEIRDGMLITKISFAAGKE